MSGFDAGRFIVVAEQDILGDRLVRRSKKRRRSSDFIAELASLAAGDVVVHSDHGIGRFIGLMTTLDWSDRLGEIKCPTLIVMPGGETVGSIKNYDVMIERIPDSQAIAYEGMPHNICDAAPDRCVEDVLAFLRWRFGEPR